MSALTRTTKKNRSGCVGVSLFKRRVVLRDGTKLVRRWWSAQCGRSVRRFSVDALGNREAFREAVRARAEWVREMAPLERERQAAKRQRNGRTYRARYAASEQARNARYRKANTARINARRAQNASPAARAAAVARTRAWRQRTRKEVAR